MQTHDFDPGISSNSVFWTRRIPESAVEIDFDDGTAEFELRNFRLEDYFTIPNALIRQGPVPMPPPGPPPVPASVSFEINWHGPGQRVRVNNPTEGFAGEFILDTSQIRWSGHAEAGPTTPAFRFHSTGKSTNEFSLLGRERNGRFFS